MRIHHKFINVHTHKFIIKFKKCRYTTYVYAFFKYIGNIYT